MKYVLATLICIIFSAGGTGLSACAIPLYGYALEFWPADDYVVEVRFSGAFSIAERLALEPLETAAPADEPDAVTGDYNLSLRYKQIESENEARIAVYYPGRKDAKPFWEGPLNLENVRAVLDSPVRRKMAKQLLAGKTAVWVILGGNSQRRTGQIRSRLQTILDEAKTDLSLPLLEDGKASPYSIEFSILSVTGDSLDEAFFRAMLHGIEPDLAAREEPLVFPVYGRGRALYGIAAGGLNRRTVLAAGQFLVAACTCQVKGLQPGTDLLLHADWEKRARFEIPDSEMHPELVGLNSLVAGEAETVSAETTTQPKSQTETSSCSIAPVNEQSTSFQAGQSRNDTLFRNLMIVLVSLLGIIIIGSIIIKVSGSHT